MSQSNACKYKAAASNKIAQLQASNAMSISWSGGKKKS